MSHEVYLFGEFRFVPSARELWRRDRRVDLPRRTFECLEHLIANRDRAVGRDELVAAVFGRPNVSDAQLGQIVLRTRRAVDDDGNAQHAIRTIAGFGYRWVAETSAGADDAPPVPLMHANDAETGTAPAPPPPSTRARRYLPAAAIAALALALIGAAAWLMLREHHAATTQPNAREALHADSIVVLPIEV